MNRDDYKSKELIMRERAKMYLDKLIVGITPVDDSEIDENDVVYDPKIANCFRYLSDYLGGLISKEQRRTERKRRVNPFNLTAQEQLHIPVVNGAISVSDFTDNINSIANLDSMKPLKPTSITAWLLEKGFLQLVLGSAGKNKKTPTDEGRKIGIITEMRQSKKTLGEYQVLLYTKEAQQFIADNIVEIIDVNNKRISKN